MLGNSAAEVVVVVRTRPRTIPLAMKTMRKSIHGFPFLSHMSMGLRLAALRVAGAPLLHKSIMLTKCEDCSGRISPQVLKVRNKRSEV